jgi:hypothetical protein
MTLYRICSAIDRINAVAHTCSVQRMESSIVLLISFRKLLPTGPVI